MAWGRIRQHTSGATWENSRPPVHHNRILRFLGLNKRHSEDRRKQSQKRPRGGGQSRPQPSSFTVLQRTRPTTKAPPPTIPPSMSAKPPLRSMYDDPAFSADPRSNPHYHDQTRHPTVKRLGESSLMSSSGSQSRRRPPHRRELAIRHQAGSDRSDEMDVSLFPLLAPPGQGLPYTQSSSHSSESANTNTTTTSTNTSVSIPHTTPPSSNYSPPSSNDHSTPVKQSTPSPVNRPPPPVDQVEPISHQSNAPPYAESIISEHEPEANFDHHQTQQRPLAATRGISAPELHHTPRTAAPPPRPLTAPIHDADNRPAPPQRRDTTSGGSRQGHNPQRPRELDRIDELDETDPFGSGLHHKGPYEAINAILGGGVNADGAGLGNQRPGLPKPTRPKRTAYQIHIPDAPILADPYAPLHLQPGQILARAPLFDPQTLEQTPYHRKHHSISSSYQHVPQVPVIVTPLRNSDRPQPRPRYFPQQQQLEHQQPVVPPPSRQPPSPGISMLQVDRYQQPPPTKSQKPHQSQPRHHSQLQPKNHPSPQPQDRPQPQPQSHPQLPPQPPPPQEPQSHSRRQPPPRSQSLHRPHSQSEPQHHLQPQPQPQPPPQQQQSQSRHKQPQIPPQSQPQSDPSQPPPPTVRVEPWSQDRHHPRSETSNHHHHYPASSSSSSSRYDNQQGPIPLHVPKRLVMPSPLHQPNAPPPPSELHHPSDRLRPTPAQPQYQDPNPIPPTAILTSKSSHRAEDITMLPDGRKLQRKRTSAIPPNPIPAKAPITMHVPLGDKLALNGIPSIPSQDRAGPQGHEMKRKEKAGKRLSKRRNDI